LIAMRLGKPPAGYGHWTYKCSRTNWWLWRWSSRSVTRGPQNAKKNGMTKPQDEYWVIPPKHDGEFVALHGRSPRNLRAAYDPQHQCCAWTSNRSSYSRRRGCRSRQRRSTASVSITSTSVTARPAFLCSPNHSRASDKRLLARGGPNKTGPSKSPSCWMGVMPAVRKVTVVCDNLNTHSKGAFYEASNRTAHARTCSGQLLLHAETRQLAQCRRMRVELPGQVSASAGAASLN